MSAPVTTPIPDVVASWILVYPAADPIKIEDLLMMKRLADNIGPSPGNGYQAHHIIRWSDGRVAELRKLLTDP